MRVIVESYRYDGPHRNWDPARRRLVAGHQHWDWRYKIVTDSGMAIYRRSGFCVYGRAIESLCRNYPKVLIAMNDVGSG